VKRKLLKISFISVLIMMVSACSSIPGLDGGGGDSASTMGLVNTLSKKLGVSNDQAMGGAGALFGLAKKAMSSSEFAKVSESIPGMESLLAAAPKASGMAEKLGGLGAMMGGDAEKATGLASVAGSFSKLGLSPDMAGKFVPEILDYAKSSGGEEVMNMLKGAWQ